MMSDDKFRRVTAAEMLRHQLHKVRIKEESIFDVYYYDDLFRNITWSRMNLELNLNSPM
uniref:Uncharacterized protein n=1 Tax=Hyaloperonospora arabidopsidis (strain Emoy2) TaxID=559515 RepID=M4B8L4_HYAAE